MSADYGTATTTVVAIGAAHGWGKQSHGTATSLMVAVNSAPTVPTVGQIWPRGNQIQR